MLTSLGAPSSSEHTSSTTKHVICRHVCAEVRSVCSTALLLLDPCSGIATYARHWRPSTPPALPSTACADEPQQYPTPADTVWCSYAGQQCPTSAVLEGLDPASFAQMAHLHCIYAAQLQGAHQPGASIHPGAIGATGMPGGQQGTPGLMRPYGKQQVSWRCTGLMPAQCWVSKSFSDGCFFY